ncbi:cytochrome P450 [Marinibaculum pumilum]|uniref:Cytochrome P450 n=1 Tax=Marinibaculum pumilum TaxID=1766165 RepID=A0ABV7KUN6_9PROT
MYSLPAPDGPDPFPAYDRLRRQGPQRDTDGGAWLLTRFADVRQALQAPQLRIRPAAVPGAPWLGDGPAAALFRNHVRMSDGDAHRVRRSRMAAALERLSPAEELAAAAAVETDLRLDRLAGAAGLEAMSALAFPVPLSVVAHWLGLAAGDAERAATLAGRFAPALLPWSAAAQLADAQHAAADLTDLLSEQVRRGSLPFFQALTEAGGPLRPLDTAEAVAAAAGLLAQACDATAGLLGKTLALLLRDPALAARVRSAGTVDPDLLDEVLRFDPPNHSTRRVAAAPVTIGGAAIRPGDDVVLILAAAGRDARVHVDPGRFEPDRFAVARRLDAAAPRHLVFGAGPHACPGEAVARAIVAGAAAAVLRHRRGLSLRDRDMDWRPSGNARIPACLWLA